MARQAKWVDVPSFAETFAGIIDSRANSLIVLPEFRGRRSTLRHIARPGEIRKAFTDALAAFSDEYAAAREFRPSRNFKNGADAAFYFLRVISVSEEREGTRLYHWISCRNCQHSLRRFAASFFQKLSHASSP